MFSTELQLHSRHQAAGTSFSHPQIVEYISPFRPVWKPPMNDVCIQLLQMPHCFETLRPFCRKPCIVSTNFSSVGIHLCPVTIVLTEHIPPRHRLLHTGQHVAVHRGHSIDLLLQPPLPLVPQACTTLKMQTGGS